VDGLGILFQFFDNRKSADEWVRLSFENSAVR